MKQIPANIEAERAILGACMISSAAVEDAAELLEPGDFFAPYHQRTFEAIMEVRRHAEVEPTSVHSWLVESGTASLDLGDLAEMMNATPSLSNVRHYAKLVTQARVQRDLIMVSSEIARMGEGLYDDESVDRARALLEGVGVSRSVGEPDWDVQMFLGSTDMSFDWLVPGFLERGDRMIVTGGEGLGKSTLLLQMAVHAAAGKHEWTGEDIAPVKTAIIDLENKPRKIARQAAPMVRALGPGEGMLNVISRQTGINLATRADRAWLLERIEANNTELLLIGPLYKMMAGTAEKGDAGGEDFARTIVKALDDMIERTGVTIITEAHAPHGGLHGRDLRPAGSSVWRRWPDMGVGLRQDPQDESKFILEQWRGDREQRTWPASLQRGGIPEWPWMPMSKFGQSALANGTFKRSSSA